MGFVGFLPVVAGGEAKGYAKHYANQHPSAYVVADGAYGASSQQAEDGAEGEIAFGLAFILLWDLAFFASVVIICFHRGDNVLLFFAKI
ncbi:MAG: hypothetical protein SPL53_00215 [Bacteroidales bacterium]|nr:hypothetical protein [Bacteroidales bacterium]